MYEQIRSNKRKTVFIVGFFILVISVIMAIVGYLFADNFLLGVILGLIGGGLYTFISVKAAPSTMLKMSNARQITKDNFKSISEQQAYNIVSQLAMMQQIPEPDVYIIEDKQPNAFAVGMEPKKASVALTTGLMEKLNRAETEGVIAHEIAHIQNYDSRLKVTTFALGSFLVLIGHVLFRSGGFRTNRSSRSDGNDSNSGNAAMIGFLLGLLILMFGQAFSTLIQLWVSRNREYLADATAAEMTRNPQALANALRKISQMEPSEVADSSMSAMYFYNPFKKTGDSIWSTHPSTENRIKALNRL